MEGILIADDGTEYAILGTLVENSSVSPMSLNEEITQTYKFSIPASIMAGGGSYTENGNDSKSLTEAFLTVHYVTRQVMEPEAVEGTNEYLLTRVSGYWSENSPNIFVDHGTLDYYCYMLEDGANPTQLIRNKEVDNFFDVSTGFSRYVWNIMATFGATLTVHVKMGSRNWTFVVKNTPPVG